MCSSAKVILQPLKLTCSYSDAIVYLMMNRNPLYLLVLFVIFLLSRALWIQLDISGEFRNGTVRTYSYKKCSVKEAGYFSMV